MNNTTLDTFIHHDFSDKNMLLAVFTNGKNEKNLKSIDYRTLSICQKISYWWNDNFNLGEAADVVSGLTWERKDATQVVKQWNTLSRKIDHHNEKHNNKIIFKNITKEIQISFKYDDDYGSTTPHDATIHFDRLSTTNEIANQINNIRISYRLKILNQNKCDYSFKVFEIFNKSDVNNQKFNRIRMSSNPNENFISTHNKDKMKKMTFTVSLRELNLETHNQTIYNLGQAHLTALKSRIDARQKIGRIQFS